VFGLASRSRPFIIFCTLKKQHKQIDYRRERHVKVFKIKLTQGGGLIKSDIGKPFGESIIINIDYINVIDVIDLTCLIISGIDFSSPLFNV